MQTIYSYRTILQNAGILNQLNLDRNAWLACSLHFSFVFFKHLVWLFVYCQKVGTKFSSLLFGFNIGYHFGARTFYRITMNIILSSSGVLGQIKINVWIWDPCSIWLIDIWPLWPSHQSLSLKLEFETGHWNFSFPLDFELQIAFECSSSHISVHLPM